MIDLDECECGHARCNHEDEAKCEKCECKRFILQDSHKEEAAEGLDYFTNTDWWKEKK